MWRLHSGLRRHGLYTVLCPLCTRRHLALCAGPEKYLQIRLSDTQDELGVVGHLLGAPRRIPGQLDIDVLDALELARDAVDVLLDHRPDRAAHRGQRVRDLDARPLHLDVVEEAEIYDVHPELGILDLAKRLDYIVLRGHRVESSDAAPPSRPWPFRPRPVPGTRRGPRRDDRRGRKGRVRTG